MHTWCHLYVGVWECVRVSVCVGVCERYIFAAGRNQRIGMDTSTSKKQNKNNMREKERRKEERKRERVARWRERALCMHTTLFLSTGTPHLVKGWPLRRTESQIRLRMMKSLPSLRACEIGTCQPYLIRRSDVLITPAGAPHHSYLKT